MDILLPSWFFPTTLALFIPCILIYTILHWKSLSYKLPPSPPRFPLIGNLHQISGRNIQQILWKLSQKYGPVMLLHFGTQPVVVLSSSEVATQVLKTLDHDTCSRPYSRGTKRITFNYMDVAFSPYNDHWKDMRKFFVSEVLGKRTRLVMNVMEIELEGLVHSLSLKIAPINVEDMVTSLVSDVVCKVAFGKSYRERTFNGRTMKQIVDESVVMSSGSFSDSFPICGWVLDELTGWNRRLEKCFCDVDGFLQMIIDEHIRPGSTKTDGCEKDLVDECISRLTTDETKAIMLNLLNGAIDSTTGTVVWGMSEIVKNPRIMQKLQTEIRSCVGRESKVVKESDISKMSYLQMVVKETLRMHAPTPFLLTRECGRHCQIGGYDVFPGTKVLINSWGIGRDERTWKEWPAEEFYPERFEQAKVDYMAKQCEMIPFGGGRRGCPGYNMGVSATEVIIANLFHLLDWETPSGMKIQDLDMEEECTQLIHRKTPLCLVPITHTWED